MLTYSALSSSSWISDTRRASAASSKDVFRVYADGGVYPGILLKIHCHRGLLSMENDEHVSQIANSNSSSIFRAVTESFGLWNLVVIAVCINRGRLAGIPLAESEEEQTTADGNVTEELAIVVDEVAVVTGVLVDLKKWGVSGLGTVLDACTFRWRAKLPNPLWLILTTLWQCLRSPKAMAFSSKSAGIRMNLSQISEFLFAIFTILHKA